MTASSLSALLRERIAVHARAGRTALLAPDGSLSYAGLGARIDGHAGAFRDLARGEAVGIPATRSAESVARFFGVMQAGGCPCFYETGLAPEALLLHARAVGLRRIVVDDELADRAQALEHEGLRVQRADDLPRQARRASGAPTAAGGPLGAADLAMMQFTSGSTGRPKGALLTHGNLLRHAAGILERTALTPADRLLHVMPLHHTNGVNNQLVAPLLAGASVVLAERFRAEDIGERIAEHGVTYLTGAPTMYSRILPHLGGGAGLRSLRFLRCGSAPLPDGLHEAVEATFGVPLIVSYGLSEATCSSTMNPVGARRIGSVGTVLAGQQVRIFRPGTDAEAPAGAEGEIRIAGPCLMRGYAGDGAESPIRDGWLRTGDLGRFDPDGYLAITGRLTEMIVRGGENLSPRAIESAIERHPAVEACCVVGNPHPDLGEVPVAFVVRRGDLAVDAAALAVLVRRRLSRRHVPAAVRFVSALPLNAVGKIDRRALRMRSQ